MTFVSGSCYAVDARTGCYLRPATTAETESFDSQPVRWEKWRSAFEKPIRVGDVLIDRYTGPGGHTWPVRGVV